jgi:hypothetical protein
MYTGISAYIVKFTMKIARTSGEILDFNRWAGRELLLPIFRVDVP